MSFKSAQESGRSMVEMLGVLIVASVLTIGSITTFQYARNLTTANTIISEVRMRLAALSRHGASKNEATSLQTLKGFQKKPNEDKILNKYEVTLSQPEGEKPTLILSNIPTDLCHLLEAKTNSHCDDQGRIQFGLSSLNVIK